MNLKARSTHTSFSGQARLAPCDEAASELEGMGSVTLIWWRGRPFLLSFYRVSIEYRGWAKERLTGRTRVLVVAVSLLTAAQAPSTPVSRSADNEHHGDNSTNGGCDSNSGRVLSGEIRLLGDESRREYFSEHGISAHVRDKR